MWMETGAAQVGMIGLAGCWNLLKIWFVVGGRKEQPST